MGGHALKSIETRRCSTSELRKFSDTIQSQILHDLDADTYTTRFYSEKQDHGDIDILLKVDHTFHNKNINIKKYIQDTFAPNEINNNGGVYSFDYNNVQIDIIPIKESNWGVARTYFNFDPIGNLQGKLYHQFHLKYGFQGLVYPYRTKDSRVLKDITISKDPYKIFEFIGLDYNQFTKGFDTLQEIFDFILTSKYFNPDKFKFENLTGIDRKRNAKRKTYHQFLEYINNKQFDNKFIANKDKSVYISEIDKFFGTNLGDQIKSLKLREEQLNYMHSKFNGNLIMQWIPGLQGKELGDAITKFKKLFKTKEMFDAYIMCTTPENIKELFKSFADNLQFYNTKTS